MAAKKRATAKPNRKRNREEDPSSSSSSSNDKKAAAKNNKKRSSNANTQLRIGVYVLIVAIVAGFLWNLFDSSDPRIRSFLSKACRKSATCAPFVSTTRRTLQAARPVRTGETLVEIPREMQLWDLDALRDEFISKHLFEARHLRTGNHIPPGAFLAARLAMLVKKTVNETTNSGDEEVRKAYLEVLPTAEELSYHPIFWDQEELEASLSGHSLNYGVVLNHREMVESEYKAFVKASPEFGELINATEYQVARVNVLTRSFSPGPVGIEENLDAEELEFYKDKLGIDFSEGCHAMVPILDMLNHHPNPNVVYNYNKEKRAFVISAKRKIPAGWELIDSYGRFSDGNLFAKFGFTNGDGSGYTHATIAAFHSVLDYDMKDEFSVLSQNPGAKKGVNKAVYDYQRTVLVRYLQFDDGYQECVDPEKHPEAFRLKELKLEHLLASANDGKRWTIRAFPRAPKSLPVESTDVPIIETAPKTDILNLRMDMTPLINHCRLMSLIHTDMNGRAIDVLTENLGNENFVVEKSNDELEFRALLCVGRLSSMGLAQYEKAFGRDVNEAAEYVSLLTRDEFQSRNWTIAQLRLGEMQTLNMLTKVVFSNMRQIEKKLPLKDIPALFIRDDPCPNEYVESLKVSKQ